MARKDPRELDLLVQAAAEKHNLNAAQVSNLQDEAESRGISREKVLQDLLRSNTMDEYARQIGFPTWEIAKEAVGENERRATNERQTTQAERASRLGALKDMAMSPLTIGNERYSKALLDAFAKEAGLNVPPEPVDPKKAAISAFKGEKAPATATPPVGEATAPTPTSAPTIGSLLQPNPDLARTPPDTLRLAELLGGGGTSKNTEPTGYESAPSLTPHLGIGGAPITADNPTGNPDNPWGPGGLFDNPTHQAALNVQANAAQNYPLGPDSRMGSSRIIAGPTPPTLSPPPTAPFDPTKLVASNVPTVHGAITPAVNTLRPAQPGNALPPSPVQPATPTPTPETGTLGIGWNTRPGSSLLNDWLSGLVRRRQQPATYSPLLTRY